MPTASLSIMAYIKTIHSTLVCSWTLQFRTPLKGKHWPVGPPKSQQGGLCQVCLCMFSGIEFRVAACEKELATPFVSTACRNPKGHIVPLVSKPTCLVLSQLSITSTMGLTKVAGCCGGGRTPRRSSFLADRLSTPGVSFPQIEQGKAVCCHAAAIASSFANLHPLGLSFYSANNAVSPSVPRRVRQRLRETPLAPCP